ncbi:energy transducer TonB [Brevundimonas vitis]|uniref:Energy transducer TonB n=1 Tax=Brevundimonas vitisensis TaxID=2800818 RepID=A0ABX7BNA0_9CAUL|nr:energy transducer TonB [Brevundimonas vitisensis]
MTILAPAWSRSPRPEFPLDAVERGISSGLVGASCSALANGRVVQCEVLYEEHPGLGFGDAALASLRQAVLSPRTVDGAAPNSKVLIWLAVTNSPQAN